MVPGPAAVHVEPAGQAAAGARRPLLRHPVHPQGQKVLAVQPVAQVQLQGARHHDGHRRHHRDQQRTLPHGNPAALTQGLQIDEAAERQSGSTSRSASRRAQSGPGKRWRNFHHGHEQLDQQ